MTSNHLPEDRFDPERDPIIRRWASRFNLQPDDTIVIMTAAIEHLCTELLNEFKQVKTVVEGKQEGWLNTLTEALKVIQLQQENQAGLRENCKQLTTSLERLERKLNEPETLTEISLPELTDLATQLPLLQAAIEEMKDISAFDPALLTPQVNELKQSISTQLDEIRVSLRVALKKDLTAAIENLSLSTPATTLANERQSPPVEVKLPRSIGETLERIDTRGGAALYELENLTKLVQALQSKNEPRIKTWTYKAKKLMRNAPGFVRPHHFLIGIVAIVVMFFVVLAANYQGYSQAADQLGGRGDLLYWQELLGWNQARISECQRQDKAECLLKVPPRFPPSPHKIDSIQEPKQESTKEPEKK